MCCANLIYLVNFFLPTRNYFLLGTFSRRTFSLSFHQPMIRAVEASGPEKLGFPAWAQARVTKDWRFIVSNRLKNIWSLSCRFLLCCLYMSKNRLFFFTMSYFTFLIFSFFSLFISPFLVNWWWIRLGSSTASQSSSPRPRVELTIKASGATVDGGDSSKQMSPF